jgi:hypothetical protein
MNWDSCSVGKDRPAGREPWNHQTRFVVMVMSHGGDDPKPACSLSSGVSSIQHQEEIMSAIGKDKRNLPQLDSSLVANIRTSHSSYFICSHRLTRDTERVEDEATIEIEAQISKIEPLQSQHLGHMISCSVLCARTFERGPSPGKPSGIPLLYSITLRKNARSLLAYLPADAFWALEARLEAGKVNYLEACYQKPSRGYGQLTSLHFF